MTAETPAASSVHHPFGSPSGPGLWHMKGKQLPAYIQNVAHALIRSGSAAGESDAIHKAVGIVQDWAAGKRGVTPQVQAAAQRAVSQWYKLRGERAARTANKSFTNDREYLEMAGTTQPKQKRGPNSLTSLDFHKVPAAMRRVRKHFEGQGIPKDQALAKTVAFFHKLQSSPNPVLSEASVKNLKSLKKRKSKAADAVKGRKGQAGGDTGVPWHFSNAHHDGTGKFTGNTKERERILRTFQEQHNIPVTGIIDTQTRELLDSITKAANEH